MKKNIFKIIIFISIIMIILLVILVKVIEKNNSNQTITNEQLVLDSEKQEEENQKKTEESVLKDKLSNMTERERMEFYFSQFIAKVESREYEEAYNMLYDEFKENYFPELNDFEIYVKSKFPKMMNVEYTNFERSGEIYILFVTIDNALLKEDETSRKEMKFVVKETGINEFVMSFSAE